MGALRIARGREKEERQPDAEREKTSLGLKCFGISVNYIQHEAA